MARPSVSSRPSTAGRVDAADKQSYFDALMAARTEQSIILMDLDHTIVAFNAGAEANYGYSAHEIVGTNASTLHATGETEARRLDAFHQKCLAEGSAAARMTGRRKDGEVFPTQVNLSCTTDEHGEPTGFLLIGRDLGEEEEVRRKLETAQEQLRADLLELSTPIMQVGDRTLALPIIGTLDSGRTQTILENLLMAIQEKESEIVILDVSGVPAIDSVVGRNLLKAAKAALIMGAQTVISGIRPETAQTIVDIGIDFEHLRTKRNVQDAIEWAQAYLAGVRTPAAQE